MKILITGGTGLIGSALIKQLSAHQLIMLTRDIQRTRHQLQADANQNILLIDSLTPYHDLNHFDAVINLAGEPIANKRWTKKQKQRIRDSRLDITDTLVSLFHASATPPSVFISGSAVGFYGDQQNHPFDEQLKVHHNDFTHQLCAQWEEIARRAESESTRVCLLRTGIVLSRRGGALPQMAQPFWLGLGGPIGEGHQYMPWIHITDMVHAIVWLLETPHAHGPFNLCAPHPTTNQIFSQHLAQILHRPSFFRVPKWLIKIIMGEASTLILDSIRAKPQKLIDLGFQFKFTTIESALRDLFNHN